MLEYRPFGRTGEQVTPIGLGGGPLDTYSLADGEATVRRALELGVNYFDTAPIYGSGASQVILGKVLKGREEQYLLATKLGGLATPRDFRSKDALRAQLWESLRALRRPRVDVLQVHMAEWACWWEAGASPGQLVSASESYDFAHAPVISVLREAKEQGMCRFIGITGDNADPIAHVLREVEVDVCLIAGNYNLLFRRSLHDAIPLAHQKGVAFVDAGIFKPWLPDIAKYQKDWIDSPPGWVTPEVHGRLAGLYDIQRDSGMSLVSLAVRFPLANPGVTTVVVGAATPAELEESVEAAHEGPLPPDLHRAIDDLSLV